MFQNIGSKIKSLVFGMFVIEMIMLCVAGLAVMRASALAGLVIIAVGGFFSYIGSLGLYGFGQMIENTDILVQQGKVAGETLRQGKKEKLVSRATGQESPKATTQESPEATVICGSCGYQYKNQPKDTWSCPRCGSTLKHYQ